MEKEPKNEKLSTIIDRREVRDFIEAREIDPEDLHLIEEMAGFPKNIIIETMHNLFNTHREKSGEELERMIESVNNPSKKELLEAMQKFYKKYDWTASWNLVRLLED